MLCVFVTDYPFSHASTIKKTKALKGLKFRIIIGRYQVSDIIAVEGLTTTEQLGYTVLQRHTDKTTTPSHNDNSPQHFHA